MIRISVVLLVLGASSLAAQQNPLAGTWKISYPGGMQMVNGETQIITATGTLTIAVQGDSLIGNLVADPAPDRPSRPPRRLAARIGSGETVFESRSAATLNMGGSESTATAISRWKIKTTGDKLEGTVESRIEGVDAPSMGPQPVAGTRQKQ